MKNIFKRRAVPSVDTPRSALELFINDRLKAFAGWLNVKAEDVSSQVKVMIIAVFFLIPGAYFFYLIVGGKKGGTYKDQVPKHQAIRPAEIGPDTLRINKKSVNKN
ncbi:hypothetical protein [Mucilaginibacter paludis]|uniref:Uncharacterized protein n=1 Tax=Mucilaginibacter paludis DSM 18603 TaxID=714943 RepID=H1YAG5_9SPHI|nr:hypothetical protein [Mucilaginibacter paludis]EHQ27008.1 hypothetical protein Mucpa_2899 [Mucilaginibacter paludis DSM 18603]